ncbi:MAG TPA: MFS transporter [Ilumatobacteraceae bacterium]|nr:MFS transporter [Ilumatobacteraceae bacterium]
MAFQVPVRLLAAVRPSVPAALLVAIASSTAVFTATPFLLPAVSDEYDVAVSTAGWMSTTQLAGFVLASWVGGRFLRPVRSVFVIGALIGAVANLGSAGAPTFEILALMRFGSGLSLGFAAWIAWQAAFGDSQKTGDVAVVGPLVGVVMAPLIALILESIGLRWLFILLAVFAATPLIWSRQVPRTDRLRPHRTRHTPTRAARAILVALGTITLGGSSVFVYSAAIGKDLVGLSPLTVSLLFSCNALAGIPSARWAGRRGPAGVWFLATAMCALAIAASRSGLVFGAAIVGWGFVFFMGVPAAFKLLAERSSFPEERAGDAQAVMALGRVFGPLVGGTLIAAGSAVTLGFVAAGVIALGASLLLYVDRERFVVVRQYGAWSQTRASVDSTQHA